MKIKDIMSKKLVTCNIGDSITKASNLMKENDIGFILVMDKDDLYGVVTDRDIAINISTKEKKIKDYTNIDIVYIDENESIEDALDLMKSEKVKRLIVTKDDKLEGVLSLSDILSTDLDSDDVLETIRVIYEIKRNDGYYEAKVDEFEM